MIRIRKNFNLTELIVICSILFLFAAISLPALSNARETAQEVACANQLKNLGYGVIFYSSDYKGWTPGNCLNYPRDRAKKSGDLCFPSGVNEGDRLLVAGYLLEGDYFSKRNLLCPMEKRPNFVIRFLRGKANCGTIRNCSYNFTHTRRITDRVGALVSDNLFEMGDKSAYPHLGDDFNVAYSDGSVQMLRDPKYLAIKRWNGPYGNDGRILSSIDTLNNLFNFYLTPSYGKGMLTVSSLAEQADWLKRLPAEARPY